MSMQSTSRQPKTHVFMATRCMEEQVQMVGDKWSLICVYANPPEEIQLAAITCSKKALAFITTPTPAAKALHKLLYGDDK